MKVELLHSFTSNDNKIIGRKEGLVFDQNMANQTFDAISGHSISQFLTNRQADSKMRLVFAQAVNNEFPIGNILTTFKTSTPSFKFILLYHIFKKNQSHSGNRLLLKYR